MIQVTMNELNVAIEQQFENKIVVKTIDFFYTRPFCRFSRAFCMHKEEKKMLDIESSRHKFQLKLKIDLIVL